MKKNNSLIIAILSLFLVISCTNEISNSSSTFYLTLPHISGKKIINRAGDALEEPVYDFCITVTDNKKKNYTEFGKAGETIELQIPYGHATLSAIAFEDSLLEKLNEENKKDAASILEYLNIEKINHYAGETDFEANSAKTSVEIVLKKVVFELPKPDEPIVEPDPEIPDNPDEPKEPDEPADEPDNPTEPDTPTEPSEEPVNPDVPSDPDTPTEPSEEPDTPVVEDPDEPIVEPEPEPPAVITYTVTFDSNGGTEIASVNVNANGTVSEPATPPVKANYVFKGWYIGDAAYDFTTAVTANLTLTAKWNALYTVTFVVSENEEDNSVFDFENGTAITADYLEELEIDGWDFLGWYDEDDNKISAGHVVTGNLRLEPKWQQQEGDVVIAVTLAKPFEISVRLGSAQNKSTTPGTYAYLVQSIEESSLELSATPSQGVTLFRWYNGNAPITSDYDATITYNPYTAPSYNCDTYICKGYDADGNFICKKEVTIRIICIEQSNKVGFNLSSENGWFYSQQNGVTLADDETMTAFCYDPEAKLVIALKSGNDSIFNIYTPSINGYTEDDFVQFTFPTVYNPQRITSSGKYIYFTTTKYGVGGGKTPETSNSIYYFDSTGETPKAATEIIINDFDVVTALTYFNGNLYVGGEKRGEIIETITDEYSSSTDYSHTIYNSTYAVYVYDINADGILSTTKTTYLSYTDDDVMEEIRTTYPSHYREIMYMNKAPDSTHDYTYHTWINNTISDMAVQDGKVYVARNAMVALGNCNKYTGGTGQTSINIPSAKGTYFFGNIVSGNNGNIVNESEFKANNCLDTVHPEFIPCRFIAIKPKEFDMTSIFDVCISSDPAEQYMAGTINLRTQNITLYNPDGGIDSIRKGSGFSISLSNATHLYFSKSVPMGN